MKKGYKHAKKSRLLIILFTTALVSIIIIFSLLKLLRKPEIQNLATKTEISDPVQAQQESTKVATTLPSQGTSAEIQIGTIVDLSGSTAEVGSLILKAMNLRIDEENTQGGINGQKIKLFSYDHQYERVLAHKHAETLINIGINTILVISESAPLAACLDLIEKKEILVLFSNSGLCFLRRPDLSHLIFFKTSYENELKALAEYAIQKLSAKKIALFCQDDPEIFKFLPTIIRESLKKNNLNESNLLTLTYTGNSTLIPQTTVDNLKTFNPDALIFLADPIQAKILLSKLGQAWLQERKILGNSAMTTPQMYDTIKDQSLQFVFSHVFPKLQKSNLEIVKLFEQKANSNNLPLTDFAFQGYLYADLLIGILKQIEPPYTKEKIIQKIESLKNYQYKGLTLNFDPKTRELSKDIWLELPNGEWIYSPLKEDISTNEKKN